MDKKIKTILALASALLLCQARAALALETRWDMRFALDAPLGSDKAIDYGRASGISVGVGLQFEDHGFLIQPQALYTNLALPGQVYVSGYLPDPSTGGLLYVTNMPIDAVERITVLEFPVLAGFYYEGRTVRPRFSLGPSLVVLTQKTREYKPKDCGCGEFEPVRPTYVNLGWAAALGVDFSVGSGSIFLEARYSQLDPFNMWNRQGAVGPVNMGYAAGFIGYLFTL